MSRRVITARTVEGHLTHAYESGKATWACDKAEMNGLSLIGDNI